MSKTYHNTHQMKREIFDGAIEYSPEFKEKLDKELKEREYSGNYTYEKAYENTHKVDASNTTLSADKDWNDVNRKNSRHPNKKKHPTLSREFKGTNEGGIRVWRHRLGNRDDKSDRMKGWRHRSARTRRTIMKRNDQKLIDEELNKD